MVWAATARSPLGRLGEIQDYKPGSPLSTSPATLIRVSTHLHHVSHPRLFHWKKLTLGWAVLAYGSRWISLIPIQKRRSTNLFQHTLPINQDKLTDGSIPAVNTPHKCNGWRMQPPPVIAVHSQQQNSRNWIAWSILARSDLLSKPSIRAVLPTLDCHELELACITWLEELPVHSAFEFFIAGGQINLSRIIEQKFFMCHR